MNRLKWNKKISRRARKEKEVIVIKADRDQGFTIQDREERTGFRDTIKELTNFDNCVDLEGEEENGAECGASYLSLHDGEDSKISSSDGKDNEEGVCG